VFIVIVCGSRRQSSSQRCSCRPSCRPSLRVDPAKISSFKEILGSSKVGVCLRGCRLRLRSSSITSTISVFFRLRLPSSSFFVFGYQLQIGLEFRILILERGLVLR